MKTNFFVGAVLVCGVGVLVLSGARIAGAQASSVTAFDRTLETLRQSVARLVKENEAINADNLATRAKIKELQEELRSVQAETGRLEAKKAAQAQKTQNRSGGVEALKAQVTEVDGMLKQAREDITAEQGQFKGLENEEAALQKQTDALNANIAAMNVPGSSSEAARKGLDALQAEQGALQKQLSDVAGRIREAKRQWGYDRAAAARCA